MQLNHLGDSGILVSRLCFGTLTVGPLQANLPLEQGADVLVRAIEHGVNFFDTAQLYETYPYIRRAMVRSGKFDIVISSKTYAHTRELAVKAVEQARKELDRDVIDIFMLHETESVHTLNGHMAALEYLYQCKQAGIIRAVGASTHHIAGVCGAVEKKLDVLHPLLNLNGLGIVDGSRMQMEAEIATAYEKGMGIFSMKPIGGGNLFKHAEKCLQYIRSFPYVHSVAVGMQSCDEVDANVDFWANGTFSPPNKLKLEQKKRHLHIDQWCAGCGDCSRICSQNALSILSEKAYCNREKCILCGYCSAHCPQWAIKIV